MNTTEHFHFLPAQGGLLSLFIHFTSLSHFLLYYPQAFSSLSSLLVAVVRSLPAAARLPLQHQTRLHPLILHLRDILVKTADWGDALRVREKLRIFQGARLAGLSPRSAASSCISG